MKHRSFPTTLLLPTLFSFILFSDALWLNIPPTGSKCVSEDIQSHVVVLVDYLVIADEFNVYPTVSVKVTSPYSNVLHDAKNTTHGQFAFTTQESGTHLACFDVEGLTHDNKGIQINLDWKTGIAAKDWSSIAKKEKLEGVELELRKLENSVQTIHENLLHIRSREAEMRIVNEKTNSRVAWYSITSLSVCIVVSGLQILYLKQYFEKRKLI